MQVDAINQTLDSHLNNSTPGLQYVVFTADTVLHEHYAGYLHLSQRMTEWKPMTKDTMLLSNSCTKAVSALCILQLVDSGKLSLDQSVEHYLPNDFPYGPHITVRHLLTHTSGIPFSNWRSARMWHTVEAHATYDDRKALQRWQDKYAPAQVVPKSKVGKKYDYSNLGYWWLGRLITQVTGLKYTDYVRQHVCEPLGITEAELSFTMPSDGNYSTGYIKYWHILNAARYLFTDARMFESTPIDGWLPVKPHYHDGQTGGGIIASVTGYRKLLQDLMQDDSRLLSKNLKQQMFSQQKLSDGSNVKHEALGWELCSVQGHKYYARAGGWMGWRSEMRIYPDLGVGSVVLANSTLFETKDVLDKVDVMMLQQLPKR